MDVAALQQQLIDAAATVAVAESLTGGLLSAALTDLAGASAVLRGGLVVYATELKAQLAGVPADLLAERGAVDPDVASALAVGVRERLGTTYGLGVTGVAGPDPQDGQPVGTVFAGCAGPRRVLVSAHHFDGDRGAIRSAAVQAALALLARESAPGPATL
ncbi:MAG: CinA family protein [bacterium]